MRFKKIIAGAMAFTIASSALPQTDWFARKASAEEYEAGDTEETEIPSVSEEEFAYGDFICRERLNFYFDNGIFTPSVGIEIIRYTGNGGSVEIPETINGKNVTHISSNAFQDFFAAASINIPKTVEQIDIFFGLVLPDYCSLSEINVDENNPYYLSRNGVLYKKNYQDTVTLISCPPGYKGALEFCEDVAEIESFALSCDFSLTEISVDENNPIYSSLDGVLYNKDQTWLIHCPSGYEGVLTVSEYVESIGLTLVCKLKEFDVDKNNPNYSSIDGVLYNKDQTELICCPDGYEGSFKIPDSVTEICYGAFFNCTSLTSVIFSKSIETINELVFGNCTGLKKIEITDKFPLEDIIHGDRIFLWCYFSEIYVDENSSEYSSIDGVLYNKDQTKLLLVPYGYEGVLRISDKAVLRDEGDIVNWPLSITAIEVDENNINYLSKDGVLYSKDQTRLIYYPRCKKGSFVIPDSVTNIGGSAFSHCQLDSIVIPDTITNITFYSFAFSSLTSVTIPDSVTNIDYCAFFWSKLSSIVIPAGVTSIVSSAFDYCPYYPDGAPEGAPQVLTIYGESGSYAETYANENNIRFEAIKTLSPGEDGGVDVEVVTKPGDVPDGAEVSVTEKDKTDVSVTFDITITVNGEEIKLSGSVYVKIPVPIGWNGSDCKVYRKEENGKYTDMKAKAMGNFLSFVTDHFSEYVITTEDLSEEGGDTGTDTEPEVTASPDFSGGFSVPEASVETAPAETSEAGTIQSEISSVSESEEVSFDVSEPVSETEGEQETTAAVSEENSALSENTSDGGSVVSDEDKNINTSAYPAAGIVLIMAAAAAAVFITKKHK